MDQMLLPGTDPSANDLYNMAIAVPLTEKIRKAVDMLRLFSPSYLAYSGGKDSDVILELCKMAGVDAAPHYNCTTMDPPELIRYIRTKDVTWNRPPMALTTRLVEKSCGPPTSRAAWCCEEYKEQGGAGTIRVVGVRAEESKRRRHLWKTVVPMRDKGTILCPICYWTEDDVWEFHRIRGLDHCCLYDQGFTRLGCVGCPKAGRPQQQKEFARWPGFERSWKRAIYRFWDKWHNVPTLKGKTRWFVKYGSAEGLWNWWIRQPRDKAECQTRSLFS